MKDFKEKNIFISTTDEEKLWNDAIFIFDSSALLAFYDYSDSGRSELFTKVIDKLSGRLWIPSHVEFEFNKNRKGKVRNPIDERITPVKTGQVNPIKKNFSSIINHYNNILEITKPGNFPPSFEDKDIYTFKEKLIQFDSELNTILTKITDYLDKETANVEAHLENDVIFSELQKRFKVGNDYSFSKIVEIIREEGELRYRNGIPPGYMDDPKYSSKSSKTGIQIYGDLIIWKQILEYATSIKSSVVFVTNDLKEDWCYVNKSNKSRIDRPREELIKEFKSEVQKDFWLYSVSDLLYFSEKYLDTNISENLIEEVDDNTTSNTQLTFLQKEKIIGNWINNNTDLSVDQPKDLHETRDSGYDFSGINTNTGIQVIVECKFSAKSLLSGNVSMYGLRQLRKSKHIELSNRVDYIIAIGVDSIVKASEIGRSLSEISYSHRGKSVNVGNVAYFFIVGYFRNGLYIPIYSDYSDFNFAIQSTNINFD